MAHQLSPEIQECVDHCVTCYRTCLHEAMNHCLEAGGEHVEPAHFRLMMNCAEICRTSAEFMLSGSQHSRVVCAACAEVCAACAVSCRQLRDMDECASTCEQCAESCRRMTGA
jgi:hypothetical protein